MDSMTKELEIIDNIYVDLSLTMDGSFHPYEHHHLGCYGAVEAVLQYAYILDHHLQ